MADLKENNQTTKKEVREFFKMGEVFGYFFRKKDPTRPTNFNIRVMHGINRISIIMFLAGVIFLIAKRFF